jgi:hypothetical protein
MSGATRARIASKILHDTAAEISASAPPQLRQRIGEIVAAGDREFGMIVAANPTVTAINELEQAYLLRLEEMRAALGRGRP